MITAENITSHELVGLEATIVQSTNLQAVGLNGRVVDETKSMLRIRTAIGVKSAPKPGCVWRFALGDGDAIVEGSRIARRSHDRIGART